MKTVYCLNLTEYLAEEKSEDFGLAHFPRVGEVCHEKGSLQSLKFQEHAAEAPRVAEDQEMEFRANNLTFHAQPWQSTSASQAPPGRFPSLPWQYHQLESKHLKP